MSEVLAEDPAVGVEGDVAAPPEEAPGVVESGPTDAVSAEVEPAAPPWAPTQDDWQALNQQLAALQQQMAPPPAAPEPNGPPDINQYMVDDGTGEQILTPDGLARYVAESNQYAVNNALSGYEPILKQVAQDQGNSVINGRFDALEPTIGKFDRDLATVVAEGLVYGRGANVLTGVDDAAKLVQAAIAKERAAAVEEYKQTLSNIGSAHQEPPAVGAGVPAYELPVGPDGRRSYKTATDNWLARNGHQ